jgi:DNA polymerase III subunit gamma/tau
VPASRGATAVALQPAAEPRRTDQPVPSGPMLNGLRDVAMLAATRREPQLHAHVMQSVHLVRFAPNVIELRPEPTAPRDLAARLAALLLDATGARWTIALSAAAGEPTLAEQDAARDAERRHAASLHPLVRSILEAFPGAVVEPVQAPPVPTATMTADTLADDAESLDEE